MALKSKSSGTAALEITPIDVAVMRFYLIGKTPLIFNRMAEKAKRTLLLPGKRLTEADKAANLKHDPVEEFRDSVYRNIGERCETRIKIPASAPKGAMANASLSIPGIKKVEVNRLCWVENEYLDVWGIPELKMDIVRMADISRTPDVRTRAVLRKWAIVLDVNFVVPTLNSRNMGNLMGAAGLISGIGDFRQEKGKGNFGQFQCVDARDPRFLEVVKTGGRAVQDRAFDDYACYDAETEELLAWYGTEVVRRGKVDEAPKRRSKRDNGAVLLDA